MRFANPACVTERLSAWRGPYDARSFTQADADESFALAVAALDDFVAIGEERARFAVRQRQRLLAAARDLDQRALRAFIRPGDRAAAEQVAGRQVAAAARVVRHDL